MLYTDLINCFKDAYENGDLTDESQLKWALQYENKLGTIKTYQAICQQLENYPSWDSLDVSEDSHAKTLYQSDDGINLVKNCRQQLNLSAKHNSGKVLRHLLNIKRLANVLGGGSGYESAVLALHALKDDPKEREQRIRIFQAIWDEYSSKRSGFWIWLFENPTKRTKVHSLLPKLGLYKYDEYLKEADDYLLFSFNRLNGCYKPSWLDADLSFYFDASPDVEEHGFTRDLTNGERGYKEWVSLGKDMQLYDVQVYKLEQIPPINNLQAAFINAHAQRITGLRP